jgi:hypothetical protein
MRARGVQLDRLRKPRCLAPTSSKPTEKRCFCVWKRSPIRSALKLLIEFRARYPARCATGDSEMKDVTQSVVIAAAALF